MTSQLCPKPADLGRYVLGNMNSTDMQMLEQHLMQCQRCCDQIETLNPQDEVTKSFGLSSPIDELNDSLINDVMTRVNQWRAMTENTSSLSATGSFVSAEDQDLGDLATGGLLNAPISPDELGRLGDYRVLRILGRGGMGFVFLAEDIKLRRRVALKVMRPSEARKRGGAERFLREARAAAAVEHDNIVTILQVGEDRGIPFIAMPLLQGESLRSILNRESRVPQSRAIAICRQVAEGLQAAHQTGLIHRDIKPDNLWIESSKDRVKLLDFGLVRELDSEDGLTVHGTVLGTPSYMSPEQAAGERVDHRSDLFSLGAVFYQMLSGKSPYAGNNLTSTLMNVARAQPQPLSSLVPGLDAELVSLVTRLNSRDPRDRPQSAAEVVKLLKDIEDRLASPPETPKLPEKTKQPESLKQLDIKVASPRRTVSRSAKPPTSRMLKYSLGAGGAFVMLLAITFFVRLGKYQVQITVDDPAISLKVDGNDILIEDDRALTRLSAGNHKLMVSRDGLSTLTDEFQVTKNGKNMIHVAIVEGKLTIDQNTGSSPTASANLATAIPKATTARSNNADDVDRKAVIWMRSLQTPINCRLMSLQDANRQWEYLTDSTFSIPEEPFKIHGIYLHQNYVDSLGENAADDLAPHIRGMRNLYALRIAGDSLTNRGLEKLLQIPEFRNIAELEIASPLIDDQIIPSLTQFKKLTRLQLANVPKMTGKGIGALRVCTNLASVGWTLATPSVESFEELSEIPSLIALEINSIRGTEGHAIAVSRLNLTGLLFYGSGQDDQMISHFARLTGLTYLNLSVGELTDQGLAALEGLKALNTLDVRNTQVTSEGVARFQQAVPMCQIVTE